MHLHILLHIVRQYEISIMIECVPQFVTTTVLGVSSRVQSNQLKGSSFSFKLLIITNKGYNADYKQHRLTLYAKGMH